MGHGYSGVNVVNFGKMTNLLKISSTICVTLILSTAAVEARQSTTNMTCSQAQQLVRSQGSILLSTGRHTFDRYVSGWTFCPTGDYIKRAYVQTKDSRYCRIGYTCTMDSPLDIWDD